jgi:osmoprotectant transport system permease protein
MDLLNRTAQWLTDQAHWAGPNGRPARLLVHAGLSAVSLLIALAIALPVGLWIGHTRRFTWIAVNSANLWRALPSLALIAIVLPITAAIDPQAGFKVYPTVVAMVVLAVPPILVNTQAGVAGVERDMVEAGRGQGMSEWQILTRVELPLSVPVIVAGIRSAAIQVVATATLGAILGGPGLGRYLVEGFATFSLGGDAAVVAGTILVVVLVIAVEAAFAAAQFVLTPRGLRRQQRSDKSKSAATA